MGSVGCDTIVLGAGALGCATAMHIKRLRPEGRVLLLDRAPRPAMGNTRRSVALFRDLFSSRTGRDLAGATIALFDHVEGELGHRLGLRRYGYYWMMDAGTFGELRPLIRALEAGGTALEVHDKRQVHARLGEHLAVSPRGMPPVDQAVLVNNAGTLSPTRLAQWYESQYRSHGGEVEYGFSVDRILLGSERGGPTKVWEGARAAAVEGPSGRRTAREVVVAAGAWTPGLLDPLGVDCHVKPQTRQAFGLGGPGAEMLHARNGFPGGVLPVLILPAGGVYLKPVRSQGMMVAGCADTWGRPYAIEDDPRPEPAFLEGQMRPVIEAYLPGLRGAIVPVSWAGQYHCNTIDGNPYVFKVSNITVVVGSSGSGIMKSDSIGRVAAAVHLGERESELFDGRKVAVADLGVDARKVEREMLII